MRDLTPARVKTEPYSMIGRRVLAAPAAVLSSSAKVVYGVLNGQVNARKSKPVHLTQDQIAVLAGMATRTVQTSIKSLVAVGLVTVEPLPATNGFKVNSYREHPVEESSLPPVLSLPKTYGPHMREVLRTHQAGRGEHYRQDADSAHGTPVDVAAPATQMVPVPGAEVAHKEEDHQRSSVNKQEQEAPDAVPVFYAEGDDHGLDYPDSWEERGDVQEVKAQLHEVGEALRGAMQCQAWDVEECNALLRASWEDSVPPGTNLHRALRRAQKFA